LLNNNNSRQQGQLERKEQHQQQQQHCVSHTVLCQEAQVREGEAAMAMYGRLVPTTKNAILWKDGYEADSRDPRTAGRGPCRFKHTPERSYRNNQWGVWLNCEKCALRLHYVPLVGAPGTSIGLGATPAHVEEMLTRLQSFDESEINGNMVRGLLKTIQGEAQVRSSHKGGKKSTGTTPKNKEESHGSSYKGDVGAKTRSNSEAAASSTGGHADEESWELFENAAVDRWEIFVRKLLKQ
jgi:hypothetical protein